MVAYASEVHYLSSMAFVQHMCLGIWCAHAGLCVVGDTTLEQFNLVRHFSESRVPTQGGRRCFDVRRGLRSIDVEHFCSSYALWNLVCPFRAVCRRRHHGGALRSGHTFFLIWCAHAVGASVARLSFRGGTKCVWCAHWAVRLSGAWCDLGPLLVALNSKHHG